MSHSGEYCQCLTPKCVPYDERFDGADEETIASSFFKHCSSYSIALDVLCRVQLLSQIVDGGVQLALKFTATCPQYISISRRTC